MISTVVLEALPTMAESMDDSNGETGCICSAAVTLVLDYLKQANTKQQNQVFKWINKNTLTSDFDDYGYHETNLIFDYFCGKDSIYKKEIMETLDSKIATADEYSKDQLLKNKLELSRLWGDFETSKNILLSNLKVPEIRQIAVNEELEAGNNDEAKRLIDVGIKIANEKDHLGTMISWQKQLLKIAQQENNTTKIAIGPKSFSLTIGEK